MRHALLTYLITIQVTWEEFCGVKRVSVGVKVMTHDLKLLCICKLINILINWLDYVLSSSFIEVIQPYLFLQTPTPIARQESQSSTSINAANIPLRISIVWLPPPHIFSSLVLVNLF